MNSNVIKLLLFLCLLLMMILFIEWGVFGASANLDIEMPATEEEFQSQSQKLAVIKLTKQSVDKYSHMVDRPLFIKGRKPVTDDLEETDSQDVSKIEDLFLVGIYSTEERMVAMFSKKETDGKYLKKSKGDDVSGWMLEEIEADKVILEREDKKQTLMLRAPKPKPKQSKKVISRRPKKTKPVVRKK